MNEIIKHNVVMQFMTNIWPMVSHSILLSSVLVLVVRELCIFVLLLLFIS